MKPAAALIGSFLAAVALLIGIYVARPGHRGTISRPAAPERTSAASIEASQAWAAARAWADPPARDEQPPIVAAATVETEGSSPEPVTVDTQPLVFVPAAASQEPSGRRGLRQAKIGRPHRLSRYVALQPIRGKRLHGPRPTSSAVADVSEPASAPAEAEPIEFSLATRGD